MKFRQSGEAAITGKSAGRAPSLHVMPWNLPYNWRREKPKNLSPVSRKVPVGHDSVCRHCHMLAGSQVRFVDPGLSTLGELGQHSVSVDNRRLTKAFPTSANFESNISVRDMVGKTWNPRWTWMCLLLVTKLHWQQFEDTWIEAPAVS